MRFDEMADDDIVIAKRTTEYGVDIISKSLHHYHNDLIVKSYHDLNLVQLIDKSFVYQTLIFDHNKFEFLSWLLNNAQTERLTISKKKFARALRSYATFKQHCTTKPPKKSKISC